MNGDDIIRYTERHPEEVVRAFIEKIEALDTDTIIDEIIPDYMLCEIVIALLNQE